MRSLVILLSGVSLYEGSAFYAFMIFFLFVCFVPNDCLVKCNCCWEVAVAAVRGNLSGSLGHCCEAFEVSGEALNCYYLEEQVQKVDLGIILLERQSANNSFLGYYNLRSIVVAVTNRGRVYRCDYSSVFLSKIR